MRKLQRLKKLHKLLKLQEQDVLAEYKQLQNISDQINVQINDLQNHSDKSADNLMQSTIDVNKLTLVRNFNQKIEVVIEQLHGRLVDNDKNFLIVAGKIKELRSSLTSIERLAEKHQLIENYEHDSNTQKQIDENINYTIASQEP